MNRYVEALREFHRSSEQPIESQPGLPSNAVRDLRWKLINEEVNEELYPAMMAGDLIEVADAIVDTIYVVIGTALAYGLPLDELFEEVHRSNMTKFDENGKGIKNELGKIIKPPHFEAPNIKKILEKV